MIEILGYWKFGYWLLLGDWCLGIGDSMDVPGGILYDKTD